MPGIAALPTLDVAGWKMAAGDPLFPRPS